MILFLDFDGVLHPNVCHDKGLLFSRRPLFEDLIRSCPPIDIVISSTWRTGRSLSELQAFFSLDIAKRIIGVTPAWRDVQDANDFGAYVRQAEIQAWLKQAERGWETWVAIDDQAHLFRPFTSNVVLTDPQIGLTEKECVILKKRVTQP